MINIKLKNLKRNSCFFELAATEAYIKPTLEMWDNSQVSIF